MAIDKILISLDQLGSFACIFKEIHDSFAIHTWSLILWKLTYMGPPGVLGIWGEWLFIFRELGSTGNYFRGAREQAHSFRDLGSPYKKKNINKEKPPFCLDFKKKSSASGGLATQTPLVNSKCIYFVLTCSSRLI